MGLGFRALEYEPSSSTLNLKTVSVIHSSRKEDSGQRVPPKALDSINAKTQSTARVQWSSPRTPSPTI